MADIGGDDYRAWVFTFASALACVLGAGLIFIDTIVKTVIGRDVRILQNHKFLAGSLGLGSGVMIFSSFYNLLPEAKEQLSSDLSIFAGHADAYLMLFYFSGVAIMGLIHWIMHRFESSSSSTSPGIENTRAIQQFMQREAAAAAAAASAGSAAKASSAFGPYQTSSSSLLPQFSKRTTVTGAAGGPTAGGPTASSSTVTSHLNHTVHKCEACVHEQDGENDDKSDGDDDESDEGEQGGMDEERYNDSEYVDDEVTSLLNNAFLQIGKTPNSRMDDTLHHHMQRHHHRNGSQSFEDDEDHDDQSIEVVIKNQKDKNLRRPQDRAATPTTVTTTGAKGVGATIDTHSDLELDLDLDDDEDGRHHGHEKSWSSLSTRTQKPFAPVNKKKKAAAAAAAAGGGTHVGRRYKGRKRTAKECHLEHNFDKTQIPTPPTSGGSGRRFFRHYQQHSPQPQMPTYGTMSSPNGSGSPIPPRSEHATHLRRTSFPRLKGAGGGGRGGGGSSTVYSTHDNLDHAIADDREHADLTEIGIQTALTIAIHKFPEGLITFLSTTADPCLGLSVFMAIAVHNLIEGYLIAFPLYIGLHSRSKAFALAAALGGFSQPLGAILGWFILRKVASLGWQVSATGCIYAMVAGMMSSIVVNGMWPQAVKCVGRNPTKVVQICFFAGIAIMGICQAVMGSQCDF
ncbi:hypothetical protein BGZ95_008310 [Linnemannia exigua]|uniref:Zip-domain-containing protein n=1 Tax=Linnemannia exigua TaxID=604196 RepID=A0AAD4DEN4_9FUNG|nr:hypothetical protein BGZ95_008310 [Linnemannia exigua]